MDVWPEPSYSDSSASSQSYTAKGVIVKPELDPIAAVTHPAPYPYYAWLVANQPLYHDSRLGMWVASSAETVTAVLTSELCRVRPAREPVPATLLNSPAAGIFRHLVRMTDGSDHAVRKRAVSTTLAAVDADRFADQCRASAQQLLAGPEPAGLQTFAFDLSTYVLGSTLGIPAETLPQTALWMSDFVRCLNPASSAEHIEQGGAAAGNLRELFRALMAGQDTDTDAGLLGTLTREGRRAGIEDLDAVVANGIGFMSQSYEATAGLIGNALLALARQPQALGMVKNEPELLQRAMLEVLRYDAPVQNTRRFVSRDGIVAGQQMSAGDTVMVVLAAANRDPAANPNPEQFDIFRADRRVFTFGAGPHACPGDTLAVAIAQAGVEELLAAGIAVAQSSDNIPYRPSANARIPLLPSILEMPASPAS